MRKVLGAVILIGIGLVGSGPAALALRPVDVVVEDRREYWTGTLSSRRAGH